ncbi:MAG: hypothetical protein H6679_03070 [Epsilonproteobacteria bacterium]|nr:hypothetical protein [Campylobacterota bacterium]
MNKRYFGSILLGFVLGLTFCPGVQAMNPTVSGLRGAMVGLSKESNKSLKKPSQTNSSEIVVPRKEVVSVSKQKSSVGKEQTADKALMVRPAGVETPSKYFIKQFGQCTQTGGLMLLANRHKGLQKSIDEKFVRLKPGVESKLVEQISDMASAEKKYACAGASATDSHVVLYHRQPGLVSFMHDVFYVLGGKQAAKKLPLRVGMSQQFDEAKTIKELDKKENLRKINDYELSDILVSANPALFSNIKREGESSFLQFIDDERPFIGYAYQGDFNALIKGACKQLNLQIDATAVKEAEMIYKKYYKDRNSLLQIFIPKDRVKDYCYLAQAYGKKRYVQNNSAQNGSECYASIDDFFKFLKGEQDKLGAWIDKTVSGAKRIRNVVNTQLRIYPHPDYFLSDNNDLKWCRADYLLDEQACDERYHALSGWAAGFVQSQMLEA